VIVEVMVLTRMKMCLIYDLGYWHVYMNRFSPGTREGGKGKEEMVMDRIYPGRLRRQCLRLV